MTEFAGALNHRIEVWDRANERLPSGASNGEMTRILRCLASVTTAGAGKAIDAMSVSAMPRFRVTVRHQATIRVGQQVRWRGRRLLIGEVVDDPMLPDRLVLHCEEHRP